MTTKVKGDFTPVNGLEEQLRRVLTDKHTPLWDFYTPLAAAPLWLLVPHHLELEGTEEVAPGGGNPAVGTFRGKTLAGDPASWLAVYSARCRAEAALKLWEFPQPMTCVAAKGYELLRFLFTQDADYLSLNLGLPECQYGLDADMIEILLERPEPADAAPEPVRMVAEPEGDPAKFLGPVKELLARDATVRAAWIFEAKGTEPLPRGHCSYELALLMQSPDDEHLLRQVELMAKALTPVQMDWAATLLRGEDAAFDNLAARQPPFYRARGFLDDS